MEGFTKLYQKIVASSIWDEEPPVCKVWVTMLALSNSKGFVKGTPVYLAANCRLPLATCEDALHKFKMPDPFSSTTDDDGRRIRDVPGGWILLNYLKYRQNESAEMRREYQKNLMRATRAVSKNANTKLTSANFSASALCSLPSVPDPETIKPPWTPAEWAIAAKNLSVPDKQRDDWWAYLDSQQWEWANGRRVCGSDPRSAMHRLQSNPPKLPARPAQKPDGYSPI